MMRKLYIFENNKVVIYNNMSSYKLWHIMKYYGHPNVFILDGGMKQWSHLKYPINTFKTPIDYSQHQTNTFEGKEPDDKMLADFDYVIKNIGKQTCHL